MNYHFNCVPFFIKAFCIVLKRLHSFGFGKIFPVGFKPLKPVSISHLEAPARVCLPSAARRPGWPPARAEDAPDLFTSRGPLCKAQMCPCGWRVGGAGRGRGFFPLCNGGGVLCVSLCVCVCVSENLGSPTG